MKVSFSAVLKFVIFVGLGLLIFYFLYQNNQAAYLEECTGKGIPAEDCSLVDKILADFKSVKIIWLIVILVIYMLSNLFRALRWNQMLETMGHRPNVVNSLGALMIGYFTNMAFPRLGEFVKTGTISKYEDIPFEATMGTVVLDRILDVICLLGVIGIALLFSFGTFKEYFTENFVSPSQSTITILGIIGIVGLIGLWYLNRLFQKGDIQNPILKKVQSLFLGFKEGISSLSKVKNLPLLIFYTIGIWIAYYLMTYLCFFSFGPVAHLGAVAGLVVFVFGTLGMVFPSPGGMGSYHLLISQALIIYVISSADAFSFSNIIFFTINIFGNIIFGLFFLIFLPFYNRKK